MSYTGVIIPTVEEPVENSGHGVGTVMWRTRGSVENRARASRSADSRPCGLWTDTEPGPACANDDARRTGSGATGVEGALERVVSATGWS
ncbi:hypothetical protein GCM10009627_15300 [Curtobacterium herbarum]|uniref:Uncharacterized protein n=1 Tax=Curtobacterium herbarum TaxID=150122 RepID=A0ABP4K769_9MICO